METTHDNAKAGNPSPMRVNSPGFATRLDPALPAIQVLTDFQRVLALTVPPDRQVDATLKDMMVGGVRALLVTDEGRLLGLITAADILGERPIQFLQNPACEGTPCRHSDIHASDVMTPVEQLMTLTFDRVQTLTIHDIAEAFRRATATHLLVIQGTGRAESNVRGIFSRSRIARECGLDL